MGGPAAEAEAYIDWTSSSYLNIIKTSRSSMCIIRAFCIKCILAATNHQQELCIWYLVNHLIPVWWYIMVLYETTACTSELEDVVILHSSPSCLFGTLYSKFILSVSTSCIWELHSTFFFIGQWMTTNSQQQSLREIFEPMPHALSCDKYWSQLMSTTYAIKNKHIILHVTTQDFWFHFADLLIENRNAKQFCTKHTLKRINQWQA